MAEEKFDRARDVLMNNRLQPTAYSVRSCVAPASGSGSAPAFGPIVVIDGPR